MAVRFWSKIANPGASRMNCLEVIRFFVNFHVVPAAIFDFKKLTNLPSRCLDTHKGKQDLKFGQNRFNGSKDIQILVKF